MDINSKAPVIIHDDIVVQAPLTVVWNLLVDIHGWPKWNKDISSACLQSPAATGTIFHWTTAGIDNTSTIADFIPEQRIAWSGPAKGIIGYHVWTLQSTDDGILVATHESWEGGPVKDNAASLQAQLNTSTRAWLESLKAAAESRQASGNVKNYAVH